MVMECADSFLMCLAAVTPAIPFPMIAMCMIMINTIIKKLPRSEAGSKRKIAVNSFYIMRFV